MVNQGSYCITQPNLVCLGGQPGFLLYTPAKSGLLGWSARVSNVYPSQNWLVRVVSQGLLYTPVETGSLAWSAKVSNIHIPQQNLIHWGDLLGFLLYTFAETGLLGWSAKVFIVYSSQN